MTAPADTVGICRWCEEPVVAIEPHYTTRDAGVWHSPCRAEALDELITARAAR